MTLRSLVASAALAGLALAPLPAAAKSGAAAMAEKLSDPGMQAAISAALRAMSEAMLDMKIAPLARAAEAMGDRKLMRRLGPDATLRDVAGPRAERMPEELSRRVPAMMGAMGGMAGAMEAMAPALKDMARTMGAAMGEAMARGEDEARGDDRAAPPADDEAIPSAQDE